MGSKTLGSLIVKLGFDPKAVDQGLKKFERDMKAVGKRMESIGKTMSIGFTGPLLFAMSKAIQAFDEEEQVTRKLQIALGGTSKKLLEQAAALQKVTTYSDDQIITQQAYAAALGHSESQITDMTNAAVGLSAGLGIGLDEAMKNLHKSTTGVTGKVLALIPGIKELTKEQLKSGEAIRIVNERFAGFAEAAALTGAGPLKVLKNQFGDLMEQIGEAVLPIVVALTQKIKELISWFQDLSPEVKESIVSWSLLVAGIGPLLILLPKIIKLFGFLFSEVGLITVTIAALAAGAIYLSYNWEKFADDWKLLWWGIRGIAVEIINDIIGSINLLYKAINPLAAISGKNLFDYVSAPTTKGLNVGNNDRAQSWNRAQEYKSFSTVAQEAGQDLFALFGGVGGKNIIAQANDLLNDMASNLNKVGNNAEGAGKKLKNLVPASIWATGGNPMLNGKTSSADDLPTSASQWATGLNGMTSTEDNSQHLVPASQWATGLNGMTSGIEESTSSMLGLKDAVSSAMGVITSSLDEGGKSFGQFALEAVKAAAQVVRAKLMEIAVNVIFGETSKFGLPGLLIGIAGATAGIAVITSLLGNIKAPALKDGAQTYGPTLAMIGDNASGKEMIHPWEKNKDFAKDIAAHLGGGSRSGGGQVEFVIRGTDLYGIMKGQNQRAGRLGNQSFTFSGKTAGGGDG